MPEPSRSGVDGGGAVDVEPSVRQDQLAPSPATSDMATSLADEHSQLVEEIRKWWTWDGALVPYVADQIRRRLGFAPMSALASVLAGLVGAGVRLALVLVVTAAAGEWAGIPWSRWSVILAFYAAFGATRPFVGPPVDVPLGPRVRRIVEDWTPLLPTVTRTSDLRDLARFLRPWCGPLLSTVFGFGIAGLMLAAASWTAPTAMGDLHIGTVVLLAWLLFDFGNTTIFGGVVLNWAFRAREARYDHHLFWPSPADSPEVRKAIRETTVQGYAVGSWITVYLVLTMTLITWDSPLVIPLGAGFILIGYIAAFGAALSGRATVHKIVRRALEQRLRGLQERIDRFGPDYTDLSPEQSQQLRDLIFLHDKIRGAPSTPTTTGTVVRTAIGLIIPTLLFLATVFGEVYAERFFEAILP